MRILSVCFRRLRGRGQRAASQSDALLLLDPGIGQSLGEAADREVRRRGAIDDRRNDAGRQEGEGSEQADVRFALGFTPGNPGEGCNAAEPYVATMGMSRLKTLYCPRICSEAEAERERRAKIVAAEGEYQAAVKLGQAADIITQHPVALQLRTLQTMAEIAVE